MCVFVCVCVVIGSYLSNWKGLCMCDHVNVHVCVCVGVGVHVVETYVTYVLSAIEVYLMWSLVYV